MYRFAFSLCVYFYFSLHVFSQCDQECDDPFTCTITKKNSTKRFYDLSFNPGDSFTKCKNHFCIGGKRLEILRDPTSEEGYSGSGDIVDFECSGRIGGRERMMIVTVNVSWQRCIIMLAEERDLALNQTTSMASFSFEFADDGADSREPSSQSKDGLDVTKKLDEQKEIPDVPFAVIEQVPIFPGCEGAGNNDALKACFSEKTQAFVNRNFNKDLAGKLGLSGRQRITVQFKIDKNGHVVDVRARASHPELEEEAKKAVMSLPQVTPGKQRGQNVGVLYALPIIL